MPPLHCNFCGRTRDQVPQLALAPRVNLAQPIIAICYDCASEAASQMGPAYYDLRRATVTLALAPDPEQRGE